MFSDLECRKKEITVLITEINVLRRDLASKGITEINDDRLEALDIVNRIERRILANMPATDHPTHEAAE